MPNIFKNLKQLKKEQEKKVETFFQNPKFEVELKPKFIAKIKKEHNDDKDSKIIINKHEAVSISQTGKRIYYPVSWYYLAYIAAPYYKEIMKYKEYLEKQFLHFFQDIQKSNSNGIELSNDYIDFIRRSKDKKNTQELQAFLNSDRKSVV